MPAPPYGFFAPPSRPLHGPSAVRVGLGLLATIGLMMWAAWLAMAGVAIGGAGAQQVATTPAPELAAAPTPPGSTVAFDQVWTSSAGNTVIAGRPIVDTSGSPRQLGAPVIRVAVTLTNNGATDWSPAFTTFSATLNRAPVQESSEGDWKYSTPIVPYTSVTLSKVFLAGSGQFTLAVHTPDGVALFTGRV
ncbi:MAG: hypothetical protein ACRDS1_01315 [Pseudonocardiaceae bacterium]